MFLIEYWMDGICLQWNKKKKKKLCAVVNRREFINNFVELDAELCGYYTCIPMVEWKGDVDGVKV